MFYSSFFIESGTGVIVKQGYVMGLVQSGEFVVQHVSVLLLLYIMYCWK